MERKERELEKKWSDQLSEVQVQHETALRELQESEKRATKEAIQNALMKANEDFAAQRKKVPNPCTLICLFCSFCLYLTKFNHQFLVL